jgi:phytoene desaturase
MIPCLQRDYSRWSQLFSWTLMSAAPHLSLTRSVFDVLQGYFKDEMLALCFSFQSKYLGMSAWKCPGAFAMLSYIEHAYGIYHTEGGLSEISAALAKVARERGAAIHLNTAVKRLLLRGRDVVGVELASGDKIEADEVVVNADFGRAMTELVPDGVLRKYTPDGLRKLRLSCSTFMMYLGLDKVYPLPHHTIVFARDYRRNVEEIFEKGVPSDDLSFYVRNASVTDPTLAPAGKSGLYVLVPVPNCRAGINWGEQGPRYRELALKAIRDRLGLDDIERHIEAEQLLTPKGWEGQYSVYEGATFNLAHNLSQMALWRPRNQFEELGNCYLVGGGTHPGSGLPTILESARISANLICRKHNVPFRTKEIVL